MSAASRIPIPSPRLKCGTNRPKTELAVGIYTSRDVIFFLCWHIMSSYISQWNMIAQPKTNWIWKCWFDQRGTQLMQRNSCLRSNQLSQEWIRYQSAISKVKINLIICQQNEFHNTLGCKFSISQMGKHGSNIAIADVDIHIAIIIFKIVWSASRAQHLVLSVAWTVCKNYLYTIYLKSILRYNPTSDFKSFKSKRNNCKTEMMCARYLQITIYSVYCTFGKLT